MTRHRVALITVAAPLATALATALLIATAGAQTRPGLTPAPTAGDLGPPTVLPTIIGVRRPSTHRSKAVLSSIPYPATISAAGPVYSTSTGQRDPVEEPAPVGEIVPVEVPVWFPFYGRDGLQYGRYERFNSRRRQNRPEQNGHERTGLSPSPRLAPAPRLAPSPALPPITGPTNGVHRVVALPAPVAHAAPAGPRP